MQALSDFLTEAFAVALGMWIYYAIKFLYTEVMKEFSGHS